MDSKPSNQRNAIPYERVPPGVTPDRWISIRTQTRDEYENQFPVYCCVCLSPQAGRQQIMVGKRGYWRAKPEFITIPICDPCKKKWAKTADRTQAFSMVFLLIAIAAALAPTIHFTRNYSDAIQKGVGLAFTILGIAFGGITMKFAMRRMYPLEFKGGSTDGRVQVRFRNPAFQQRVIDDISVRPTREETSKALLSVSPPPPARGGRTRSSAARLKQQQPAEDGDEPKDNSDLPP